MLLYDINRAVNPAIFSNISINVNLVENLSIQQYINISAEKPHWSITSAIPLIHDTILTKFCLALHKGILVDSVQKNIAINPLLANTKIKQFFTINELLLEHNMSNLYAGQQMYFNINNASLVSDIIFYTTKAKFTNEEIPFIVYENGNYVLLDPNFIESCKIMLSKKHITGNEFDCISNYYEVFMDKLKILNTYND